MLAWREAYRGSVSQCDLIDLEPDTRYAMRVVACLTSYEQDQATIALRCSARTNFKTDNLCFGAHRSDHSLPVVYQVGYRQL